MDYLTLITAALGAVNAIALSVFGYVFKALAQERRERLDLATQFNDFRVQVSREFVAKVDFRSDLDDLKQKVSTIYDMLIRKGAL
jgi:hypothetical protein